MSLFSQLFPHDCLRRVQVQRSLQQNLLFCRILFHSPQTPHRRRFGSAKELGLFAQLVFCPLRVFFSPPPVPASRALLPPEDRPLPLAPVVARPLSSTPHRSASAPSTKFPPKWSRGTSGKVAASFLASSSRRAAASTDTSRSVTAGERGSTRRRHCSAPRQSRPKTNTSDISTRH